MVDFACSKAIEGSIHGWIFYLQFGLEETLPLILNINDRLFLYLAIVVRVTGGIEKCNFIDQI